MSEHSVIADRWDDEIVPTVEPATLSAREAAIEILDAIDWATIIEEALPDIMPLAYYGLVDQLQHERWSGTSMFEMRSASHLRAWVTAHMRRMYICGRHGHDDPDCDSVPFNECDSDGEHDWRQVWALLGVVDEFLRLAISFYNEGERLPEVEP